VEKKEVKLDDEVIAFSFEYTPVFPKEDMIVASERLISKMTHVKSDGYMFSRHIEEFSDVYDFCSDRCKELATKNSITFDTVTLHKWISVLRSNPVQPMELDTENKEPTYHNHYEIAKRSGNILPLYSFVYYLQMPDNLSGIDGHLLFKNKNGNVLKYLPKENEVLVIKSDLSHAPIYAKNSTKNRIVLAGDFMIYNKNDNTKTMI
jgi:hypothetical protein